MSLFTACHKSLVHVSMSPITPCKNRVQYLITMHKVFFLLNLVIVQILLEQDPITEIPAKQKMERQKTLDKEHSKEHKAALRRAVTLAVPHAFSPSRYGTFEDQEIGENSNMSSGDSSSEMS